MTEPSPRRGLGYWITCQPLGVLWATEAGVVGFERVPNADTTALDAAIAEGATFTVLAERFGTGKVSYGDLGHWKPLPMPEDAA